MDTIARDTTAFRFDNRDWRLVSRDKLTELGISPNRIAFNKVTNAAALVVDQSARYAEFAVSETGLVLLHSALQSGKVEKAEVVFVIKMAVMRRHPVLEMVATVKDIPPREGQFGRYWWFNLNGTINDSGGGGGGDYPDMPF
jgi:hypothetical protein